MPNNLEMKRKRVANKLGKSFRFTRMIDDHSQSTREILQDFAENHHLGSPIAAYFEHPERWTMLTKTHLAWRKDNASCALPFSDITKLAYCQEDVERIATDNSFKAKIERLELISESGTRYVIPLEAGVPFYRFWRAIRVLWVSRSGS